MHTSVNYTNFLHAIALSTNSVCFIIKKQAVLPVRIGGRGTAALVNDRAKLWDNCMF
jgi:hypothetical protein